MLRPCFRELYATSDSGGDHKPRVATDGDGVWIAVWRSEAGLSGTGTDGDIFCARLVDNGLSWSSPVLVNTNGMSDSGFDSSPVIANDRNGNWIVAWFAGGAETDNDILASHSGNNGASWSAPTLVNSTGLSDTQHDDYPTIATDGYGTWIVAWVSRENIANTGFDRDFVFSISDDNGNNWTEPDALHPFFASDSSGDTGPEMAADSSGNWMIVWASAEDIYETGANDADIFFSRSSDAGVPWTEPAHVNSNAETDSAFALDFEPHLVTDGNGNWVVTWGSIEDLSGVGDDPDIFVSHSPDHGDNWSTVTYLNTNATTDGVDDIDISPTIATDSLGNWIAVWESSNNLSGAGTDTDVFVSHSTNNDETWTDPAFLNTNAAADSGHDVWPFMATDGAWNWVAAWESEDGLSGSGGDADIFCTTMDWTAERIAEDARFQFAVYDITDDGNLNYLEWIAAGLISAYFITMSGGDSQVSMDNALNGSGLTPHSLNQVYVDFDVTNPGNGTSSSPLRTLNEGLGMVTRNNNGLIWVMPGTSTETFASGSMINPSAKITFTKDFDGTNNKVKIGQE